MNNPNLCEQSIELNRGWANGDLAPNVYIYFK